ncbi:cyclic pyranopterin monophosphate synthase MoaC [Lyngbya confervoides BDU141951]|uniref:cyclic pyranopterin monophosphate synthase n=2 Tax=Lyngbya TaxID=28073 RepID=A0ABD4T8Y0_9CYAN|nr:cyclic pyranopterin monophosphate synthase MoaC [Lyngbya confervoides BDU141951]
MVDVSSKSATERQATAQGRVRMAATTLQAVLTGQTPKGDVITTARLAGIMAAKQTAQLIPLCHPLSITGITLDISPEMELPGLMIQATIKTKAETGVEMEAMTAVSVAALTLYDMTKGLDKGVVIEQIQLLEKQGGKTGHWRRTP